MPTLGVAKHLDVIKDIGPSVLSGEIDLTPNALEQLEEAFGHSVIMAVTSPTRVADQGVTAQKGLPSMSCELTPLI